MVVSIALSVGLFAPTTRAQTITQTLHLEPGKNLVSLAVQPTDPALQTLFGNVLDDILSIKGASGEHFAPGYSTDLQEWDWTQSYVVHANRAISVSVSGTPIEAGAQMDLQAGLNSVSYTQTDPMPVDEAFAGLADVLEYVEDGDGRRYPASEGRGVLHQLEPGQGYRVRLSADATLSYPTGPKTFDGDIDVNTMAEALALTGLQPGQTVGVAGYYRAGDGGGGLFEVRDSGAPTDGGLVFVPDEFVSPYIDETYDFSYGEYTFRNVPEGESVVFGSLRLELNNSAGTDPVELDGTLLHGHRHASKRERVPLMDYGASTFKDNGSIFGHFDKVYGDRRNGRIHFTYRRTLSPRRLHRTGVGPTLNAHWYGVRPASEGVMWTGTTDCQPLINHVINVAADRNQRGDAPITNVFLPAFDTYDYFGSIELAEGITLRGAAGTELVTTTNDLGHTYQPVRVRDQHTRLRVMDDQAFTHIRMLKDPSDVDYLPPDAKHILKGRPTAINTEHSVMSVGVQDIVLDGNWENNQQAWDEGWATFDELEAWGRNSPGWAGVNGSDHGGKRIPQGQRVTIRNVAILGYGSNGLLGNANGIWEVENLVAGNSLWNHVVYNANGTYRNLTLTGFAWGHAAWGAGRIQNLVFENGSVGPKRRGQGVFGIRGGDAYDVNELVGNGYFTREDGTVDPNHGTTIEGFYLDLRGSGLTGGLAGLGPNVTLRGRSENEPGRVIMDEGGLGVYYEAGNGYQKALYPNNVYENIELYDTSDIGRDQTFGRLSVTETRISNVSTRRVAGSNAVGNTSIRLLSRNRGHEAWLNPQSIEIKELSEETPHRFIALVDVGPGAAGLSVNISDSKFTNTTNTLFRGPSGQGTLASFSADTDKIEVYMRRSIFRIQDFYFRNLELFFAMTRFSECVDEMTGNTSEDAGLFEFAGTGGETVVDIPTRLLWKPQDASFIDVSSSVDGLVRSVEAIHANSDSEDWRSPLLRVTLSRSLQANERVTFDWSAAVRPIGQ